MNHSNNSDCLDRPESSHHRFAARRGIR